jgi:hypothetical protein
LVSIQDFLVCAKIYPPYFRVDCFRTVVDSCRPSPSVGIHYARLCVCKFSGHCMYGLAPSKQTWLVLRLIDSNSKPYHTKGILCSISKKPSIIMHIIIIITYYFILDLDTYFETLFHVWLCVIFCLLPFNWLATCKWFTENRKWIVWWEVFSYYKRNTNQNTWTKMYSVQTTCDRSLSR